MASKYVIHEGLRQVSGSTESLSLLMEDGEAVHLKRREVVRLLAELANAAPELLHRALEQRLISLIVTEIRETMTEGS